ncbi:MAG: hypothetical protein Q9163_001793 [Psora crenata]
MSGTNIVVVGQDLASDKATRTAESLQAEKWYKHFVPNVPILDSKPHYVVTDCFKYRQLRKDELPLGYSSGNAFTSVCINTSLYLPWLVSQCLKAGVVFRRGVFDHIINARHSHHSDKPADVIVNCTGLSARKLGGVLDQNMIPARGQTVLVGNEPNVMCDVSGTDEGDEEVCYIMQRAAGKHLHRRSSMS